MSAALALGLAHVAQMSPLATDSAAWLLAAGPAGAVATYWLIHRYYRNDDKTHEFERDTVIVAQPVDGDEEKIDHISRTRDSDIDGDNHQQHRSRVERVR